MHQRVLKGVVKFLSHCSQISAGAHVQIIGEPVGAVEVKVLTSQTHTYKLGRQPRSQGSLISVHTERERGTGKRET